jgi:hypothetical protein
VTRLSENEVAVARDERLKELQMWSIIRELVTCILFFVLICIITFSNRDQTSSFQVDHLRTFFYNTRQADNNYAEVLFDLLFILYKNDYF